MKKGERPIIYGDGTQTRDFIYIDDIIDNIIKYKDEMGTIDIGTGINTSFNKIVEIINNKLHTNIKPIYQDKPDFYVEDTMCKNPCKYKISIEDGIQKIIDSL